MPLRAVAIDVDGTLLTSRHTISSDTRSAVALAQSAGIAIILASARGPQSLRAIVRELSVHGPVIAFNGALIYRADAGGDIAEVGFEQRVQRSTARRLTAMAIDLGLEIAWHGADTCCAPAIGEGLRREAGITGQAIEQWIEEPAQAPYKLLAIAYASEQMAALGTLRAAVPPDCRAETSNPNYLEITATGVDKGSALTRLAELLGMGLADIAAIGDGENDIGLLRVAGVGVAMGHAASSVRRAADWVTGTNDGDGVAVALRQLIAHDPVGDDCPIVLIAPDSFKGTHAAADVAEAVACGVEQAGLRADRCPVADGGEGTLAALLTAVGGQRITTPTLDPLGRSITGEFALLGDGRVAVVECASASGLSRLRPRERDPWIAGTRGTGLLIAAAIDAGAEEVLVAAGGTATVDGGRGALEAIAEAGGRRAAAISVLCDVRTPWEQAATIFGPQKGADPETVGRLATRLDEYARTLRRDPRGLAMSGAAGGLAGGLWAMLDARLLGGAQYVLDVVGFDCRLRRASAVVVGEGRLDMQSSMGKIVGEITTRARGAAIPVHAICGSTTLQVWDAQAIGISSVVVASTVNELRRAGRRVGTELTQGTNSRGCGDWEGPSASSPRDRLDSRDRSD